MSIRRAMLSLLLAIAFIGCQHSEGGCTCFSPGMEVTARESSGTTIPLDSLHYLWGIDTLRLVPASNRTIMSIGYSEGLYRLIAFHGGQSSDTVDVEVRYGGPKECRTLSTQSIQFTFSDTAKPTYLARKVGGCGDRQP